MNKPIIKTGAYKAVLIIVNAAFWIGLCIFGIYLAFFIASFFSPNMASSFFNGGINFDGFRLTGNISRILSNSFAFYAVPFGAVLLIGLAVLWMLKKICGSLKTGTPFIRENVVRLRIIGWFLFGQAYLAQAAYFMIANDIFTRYLRSAGESPIEPHFTLLPTNAIVALIVLFLAEIFRYGCALQREHDTTV